MTPSDSRPFLVSRKQNETSEGQNREIFEGLLRHAYLTPRPREMSRIKTEVMADEAPLVAIMPDTPEGADQSVSTETPPGFMTSLVGSVFEVGRTPPASSATSIWPKVQC